MNTCSVNGFWATIGAGWPHTAYSTARFAVKGSSEGLIEDLSTNAPHVRVVVVMPGHVGTNIVANSARALGRDPARDVIAGANEGYPHAAPTSGRSLRPRINALIQISPLSTVQFTHAAPMGTASPTR